MARRRSAEDDQISEYIQALQRFYDETGIYVSAPLNGALYDFELIDRTKEWHASLSFSEKLGRYVSYIITRDGGKEVK